MVLTSLAEDGVVPEGLAHVVQLDGLAPQAAGEGRHLEGAVGFGSGLGLQLFVAGNSVLVFRAAGLGAAHDPLVLHAEDGLALALGGLLHLLLLGLQLQVLGVVGFVMADVAVGQLRDAVGHALQEVAVVGDHDETAVEFPQAVLQPDDHVAVQVVRRLVQDEDIRRMEQDGGEGHALALAAGEGAHGLGKVRDAQAGEHGLGLVFHEGAGVRGEVGKDLLQDRGLRVHLGVLGQEADLHVGVPADGAAVRHLLARQDAEKAALAGAVDADDADLVPLVEIEGDIIQELFQAEIQADVFRREKHGRSSVLVVFPAALTAGSRS